MGGVERFLIFLLAIPALRAHTHGIKLIIILALAYLLQQGYKKGNKKPKSLWRRSADEPLLHQEDGLLLAIDDESGRETLRRALLLDYDECARRVACVIGARLARGEELNEDETVLVDVIFWNGKEPPKSRAEEAFQGAVEYGRRAHAREDSCHLKYAKCPYGDKEIDYILSGSRLRYLT